MPFTVQELATLVRGQFANPADASRIITGVAAVSDAGASDVTFLGNLKYRPRLKESKAGAALVPQDFADDISAVAIRVTDPAKAFAVLLKEFAPAPIKFPPGIHPAAIIAPGVTIGERVSIGPYVVIEEGASIGADCIIGAHGYIGHAAIVGASCEFFQRVTIGARCRIGNRVIIHAGAVIGTDGFGFELREAHHAKVPQTGIVQVDDDVEIGANTTIDRARFGRTWIGKGTKIDNLVQIAHNVVVGSHCVLCAQVGISGSTRMGNYVTLGGQVGIVGHIELGEEVQIGAQSGITKNIGDKEIWWGTPAKPIRETKEQLAHLARLEQLVARVKALEQKLGESAKSLQ